MSLIGVLFRRVLVPGLFGLLAACSILPPGEAPVRASRQAVSPFSLEGRVSVRQEGRNHSGAISWQHARERDDILISTPLGQGVASFVGLPGEASLELADKRRFVAADMESLSEQVFGARLPLSSMPAWVLGLAGPEGQVERDELARPRRIREQGWQIDYLAYESDQASALPRRLLLQRGELEVSLIVDNWVLEPSALKP